MFPEGAPVIKLHWRSKVTGGAIAHAQSVNYRTFRTWPTIKQVKMAMCIASPEQKEAVRRSRQIDKQLQQERRSLKQEIKILLLGAGESGKSTFIKQMRIIHGSDYSQAERVEFRHTIFHNMLKGTKILVEARRRLQIPLQNPRNEQNGQIVSNYHREGDLTDEEFHPYVTPLSELWSDAGIQSTLKRSNEFQLVSCGYIE